MKLDINEVAFLHASVSEKDIKGSEASFVAKLLIKLVQEVNKLQPPVSEGVSTPLSSKKSK